jgi:hypothetical protein
MPTVSSLQLRALMPLSVLLCISTSTFAQFSAQWPPGSGANYSIATDGTNTFVNSPSTGGSIYFRASNNMPVPAISISPPDISGVHDLNGSTANFLFGNFSDGVKAGTNLPFPSVGVYGSSTAPNHGVGMQGVASGPSSTGVFGQGDFAGVQGFSKADKGFGTSGVASGAGGHGIDAICNDACATSGGLAGNFNGDVAISGPNGLTLSTGMIVTPVLHTAGGTGIFGGGNGGILQLFHPHGGKPHIELVANETTISNSGGGLVNVTNGGDDTTIQLNGHAGAVVAQVLQTAPGGLVNATDIAGNMTIQLNGESGRIVARVLQITGGSDLAEPFEVSGAIKPGMVVAIDPEHPGQLRIADKAYDRSVAGIVSGANGINPGVTMKQQGTVADGSLPVALTGRVYCWADASNGPINPGDLLTASNVPGHAMKVTNHARAHGAIIGKAMTKLNRGQGLVLVLVALQ